MGALALPLIFISIALLGLLFRCTAIVPSQYTQQNQHRQAKRSCDAAVFPNRADKSRCSNNLRNARGKQ